MEVQRSFEVKTLKYWQSEHKTKSQRNNFAQWRWKECGFDWICSIDRVTINFPSPLWLVIHWSLQSSPRRSRIQRIQRSPRMAAGYPLDSKSREGCNAVTVSTAWPETWSGIYWIYWTISTVAWTCWEDFQGLHGSNWWLDVSVSINFDGDLNSCIASMNQKTWFCWCAHVAHVSLESMKPVSEWMSRSMLVENNHLKYGLQGFDIQQICWRSFKLPKGISARP